MAIFNSFLYVYQRVNMDHGTHGMESLAAKTSLWMFWMFIVTIYSEFSH